jgi:osmotically-inducible protein OsmY
MKGDSQIRRDVEEEFESEAGLDSTKITLSVKQGRVLLCGTVASLGEKLVAEHAAARVVGSGAVRSTLRVTLPVDSRLSDDEIHSCCQAVLIETYGVPRDAIEAHVSEGIVTLNGRVRSKYERDAALHAIYQVRGVVDVIDNVRIVTGPRSLQFQEPTDCIFPQTNPAYGGA